VQEYVIELLKSRKRKDEASKALDIFLGVDDSAAFISWSVLMTCDLYFSVCELS
jgi:hypothetical protein